MSKAVKRRRGNEQGTLEKRGKVWFVRFKDFDGKRKRVSTGETDKSKAQAWLDKWMAERILTRQLGDAKTQLFYTKAKLENEIANTKGRLMDLKRVPLNQIYTRLFETDEGKRYCPKDIIEATKIAYRRFISKFVTWCGEIYPESIITMDNVTHEVAGEFLNHILEVGSPDMHRRCLTFLRCVWDKYIEMGCLYDNPWYGYKNVKNIKTVKKRVLEEDEMEKLIAVLSEKDLETRSVFVFAMETGQRFGDCCMMQWDYIKQIPTNDGVVDYLVYIPSKTKKYGTEVKVPITERLAQTIRDLRDVKTDDVYIMPTWAKLYQSNHGVNADLKATNIIKEAGIKTTNDEGRTNVGMHSLRHGFVSKLALSGKPMTTIQSFVGHTRERMTEYYSHTNIKSQIDAMQGLDYQSKITHRQLTLLNDVFNRFNLMRDEMSEDDFLTLLLDEHKAKLDEEDKQREKVIKQIEDIVDGK